MNKISKLTKKLGVKEQFVRDCIVTNHELNHLYKKKELATIDIDLDFNSIFQIKAIAKCLRVTVDAVLATILRYHIKLPKSSK